MLERSLIQRLDKLRVEAQQKESEADKLVKDTMIGLQNWENKTEELVSQPHQYREDYVNCLCICLWYENKYRNAHNTDLTT